MRLKGKVAIISGAAQGIGLAIACRFQAEGARVYALDRKPAPAPSNHEGIFSGQPIISVSCDIRDEKRVAGVIRDLGNREDSIHLLVHSAGVNPRPSSVSNTSAADLEDILKTNLQGAFTLSRLALPFMRSGGAIIHIASILGMRGVPSCAAYSASKGGLLALTRAMARDCAPAIRVNAISPGAIETDMFETYLERVANPEEERERIRRATPLQRLGKPEDIAAAALFLASDEAGWITGHNLVVDGGDSV